MKNITEKGVENAQLRRRKNITKRVGFAVGEGSCATAAPGYDKANPGINGPFALDEKLGLYFVEGSKRQRICPPLRVKGYVIDCDGKNAAILVSFKNMLGRQTTLDLPLEVVNKGEHMLALLTRNGMTLDTDNPKTRAAAIKLYLQSNCPSKITFVRVASNGWQRMPDGSEVYVYGHNVYGQPSSRYEAVQTVAFVEPPSAGTREEWFDLLKPLARDPLAVLAVSAAFAAPLLKPLNFGTLSLFFVGPSSTGKTILLRLVASVFGSPTSLLTWEGTENGIEAQALNHRDKPMVTDEVGQATGKQFSALSYRLMNPASKQRATSSGKAVEVQQTRTVIISSGEVSPIDRMTETGEVAKQGQIARLVTLPVSQDHGVWSNIDGFASGAEKSHHVLAQIQSVYGRAGREFCRSIASEIDDIAADFAAVTSDLAEAIFPSSQLDEHDGVPRRVLQNFVLFAFSGMQAIKKKVLPWTDHQVLQAVKRGFALWLPRWPVEIPPPVATPNSPRQDRSNYDDSGLRAMREAASLSR